MSARAAQHPGFCATGCRLCERDEHMAQIRDATECDDPMFAVRFAGPEMGTGGWVACGTCDRCQTNPDLDTEEYV